MMKRTDRRDNESLSRVVERFLYHSGKTGSSDPVIAGMAAKMCEIEMWEMWALTQD